MTEPKLSPLHAVHAALGASLTDFAGWLLPLRYESDLAEHHAVRRAAGIFDISHMAEFPVSGPDAAAFLDYALAGSLSAVTVGRAKYTMMLAEDGGILDDLVVYRLADDDYLVVANAANRGVVDAELRTRARGFDVTLRDDTEAIALLAVQGPAARAVLEQTEWLDLDPERSHGRILATLPAYAALGMKFHGTPLLVARTGYTGEDGFELFAPVEIAARLWEGLMNSGVPLGMRACGLAARDTLRLEAGMPLYGHELTRDVQPAQAGLGRVIPASKEIDYVGRAAIDAGPGAGARVLVGLAGEGRRAARAGYAVIRDGQSIGEVTSGVLSPTLGHPIAMAYVDPDSSAVGTRLDVDVRGSDLPVRVVPLPFYTRKQP